MNEQETAQKLVNLEKKIDAIYVSTEKTRKYFLGMLWATGLAIVLPLLGLVFAIPTFLSTIPDTAQYEELLK